MKTELTQSEKVSARITAFHAAQRLHPDTKMKVNKQDGWQGIGGIDLATYQDVPAKIEDVLSTADKIYNWITA